MASTDRALDRPLQRSKIYFAGYIAFSGWICSPKLGEPVSDPYEKLYRWILAFEVTKILWEVKKSKCENLNNFGPKISEMMRGFQIWPQNSNLITFDPLFGQKTVENRDIFKNPSFLAKKGVKYYPIWILRPGLESSHHFWYLRPKIVMIFTFWFFDLP